MANKKKKTPVRDIPEAYVAQALQILNNVCMNNHKGCSECMMKMASGACLIETDFTEKFAQWKKERDCK